MVAPRLTGTHHHAGDNVYLEDGRTLEDLAQEVDDLDALVSDAPFVFADAVPSGFINGRELVAGSGILLTDNGPGDSLIVSASGSGGSGAPTDAQYLTLATNATLSAERVLTVGHGLDGTDGGANNPFTLDVDESELEAASLGTAETDTSLVLAPDGIGGVEFRAETGTGSGDDVFIVGMAAAL